MKNWILENILDLPKYKKKLKEELKPEVKREICSEVIEEVSNKALELARVEVQDEVQEIKDNALEKAKDEVKMEFSKDKNSTITFRITSELEITTISKINSNLLDKLVSEEYLTAEETTDEYAIQLALILLVNECSEQMLDDVNTKAAELLGEDLGIEK